MSYETKIVGADDSDLSDLLDDVSQLKKLEDKKPASEEALRRRADDDLELLKDAAHSLGYWNAQFSDNIDVKEDTAKVTVTVQPGPVYHVSTIQVLGPAGKPLIVPSDPAAPPLPLKPGDAARTEPVVATENALLAQLGHQGYPFAKKTDRRVVVDHDTHTMAVTYMLDPGPPMKFGSAAISGMERLDPAYVQNRIQWHAGDTYDNRTVDETRRRLIDSGQFSNVAITPIADPNNPGQAAMKIDATERSHRTIGIGAAYNTSEGPGARVFWENRNLFGGGETLHLNVDGGQQHNGVSATFRKPDFLDTADLDFLATASVADDTPEAYHSRSARMSFGLERRFDQHLIAGLALSVEKANVVAEADTNGPFSASQRTQHYSLVGVPMYIKLDESDDLLNPTRGYRARFDLTPYQSFTGPELSFVTGRVQASTYQRLTDSDRYVLAFSGALSSLAGPSLDQIPADKRIYAGGGGSIRAYGYQMAGALDQNNRPIGGKSALELSAEARIKVTETIGIVPFIDAGSYYPSSVPKLGRRLLFGPGLGFRYYTSFGPIRLDVATPLSRRRGDSLVQFYISIGQAF
ncbi:MAG: BamA/TamA family outer membrane protein [Alphaproteobacteria bacterium]|nr:BamA/TamA family outer membrane protein [Alphaproteobacteria bacterium]